MFPQNEIVFSNKFFTIFVFMAKRQKFKISKTTINTKRGKGVYAAHTLFVPEEIADQFTDEMFTVKQVGENIIYTVTKETKNK